LKTELHEKNEDNKELSDILIAKEKEVRFEKSIEDLIYK